MSDLHLEFLGEDVTGFVQNLVTMGADVLVLAGDITDSIHLERHFEVLCKHFVNTRIIYVPGNHELYGTKKKTLEDQLSRLQWAHYGQLSILWHSIVEIGGFRFIGVPLWYPMLPHTEVRSWFWSDFHAIPGIRRWIDKEHYLSVEFLRKHLRSSDIVVSHFLPTEQAVTAFWKGNPDNVFFVTEMAELLTVRNPRLWIHGHTHSSNDFRFGGEVAATRIVCNPFGYPTRKSNPNFDPIRSIVLD